MKLNKVFFVICENIFKKIPINYVLDQTVNVQYKRAQTFLFIYCSALQFSTTIFFLFIYRQISNLNLTFWSFLQLMHNTINMMRNIELKIVVWNTTTAPTTTENEIKRTQNCLVSFDEDWWRWTNLKWWYAYICVCLIIELECGYNRIQFEM